MHIFPMMVSFVKHNGSQYNLESKIMNAKRGKTTTRTNTQRAHTSTTSSTYMVRGPDYFTGSLALQSQRLNKVTRDVIFRKDTNMLKMTAKKIVTAIIYILVSIVIPHPDPIMVRVQLHNRIELPSHLENHTAVDG